MESYHKSVDDAVLNAYGDIDTFSLALIPTPQYLSQLYAAPNTDDDAYSSAHFSATWQLSGQLDTPSFDNAFYDINSHSGFWNANGWDSDEHNGDLQSIVETASTSRLLLLPSHSVSVSNQRSFLNATHHGLTRAPSVVPSPSSPSSHSALFTPPPLPLATPQSDFTLDLVESDYGQVFGLSLPLMDDAASAQGVSQEQRLQEAYEC